MPVLSLGRDGYYYAWAQHNRLFPFFDIPTTACHTDEYLHRLVVDVPVVTASWLEGDIDRTSVLGIERGKIAVTNEILGVVGVQFAFRPYVKIDG